MNPVEWLIFAAAWDLLERSSSLPGSTVMAAAIVVASSLRRLNKEATPPEWS